MNIDVSDPSFCPLGVGPYPWYLFEYLRHRSGLPDEMLLALKFELDMKVSYYGDHFLHPRENPPWRVHPLKELGAFVLRSVRAMRNRFRIDPRPKILCNAYFSAGQELEKIGYRVCPPPWETCDDPGFFPTAFRLRHILRSWSILDLASSRFVPYFRQLQKGLSNYIKAHDIRALIVPSDNCFFEIACIQVLSPLRRPSFIFIHGLPGRYNLVDDSFADYIVVWGERIRQHYIEAGVSSDRVIVSGHPSYQSLPSGIGERWGLEDVLVLTKSMNGAPLRLESNLSDRGNLLTYVLMVQGVLGRLGVRRFRLRLHPSENPDWYRYELGGNPIEIDQASLADSLKRSSLVIGPTSTVFVESLIQGVQYLVFEPNTFGFDIMNNRMCPPFNGVDRRIPVAYEESELEANLRGKCRVDPQVLSDYIRTPFNLRCVQERIEGHSQRKKRGSL